MPLSKLLKKPIAIFFLLLFSLNYSGHYLIFCIQRWHIRNIAREEVIAGIPDRFLDVITDNVNLNWEEKGKEFSVNGEFYDVVRIRKSNGKTFLYCLNDKNEAQLLKRFAKTAGSASDTEKGKSNKHSFKSQLTDQNLLSAVQPLAFTYTIIPDYCYYEPALVSNCREIIIPPPRKLTA